jgi:hypothetical protein
MCAKNNILITAVVIFMLPSSTISAGLVSAMLTSFDGLEQALPRAYVAPRIGNDVQRPFGRPPQFVYDPNTGDLRAELPAAILDGGDFFTLNIYSLSKAAFTFNSIDLTPLRPTAELFVWDAGQGPLVNYNLNSEFVIAGRSVEWHTPSLITSPNWPLYSKVVAANIDFGPVLPPSLSQNDLEQVGFTDASLNYVEYYNHRGIVTQHVPFSLGFIPEPSNMIEGFIAALTLALCGRFWRVRIAP